MNSKLNKTLRILISPLDWGLGHATRCVPIIRYLVESGHEVILAADGRPMEFLRMEFPGLKMVRLPGYIVRYPSGGLMAISMFFSIPGFLFSISKEHRALKKIIKENKIDLVISDNRYGLWSREVPCVFITHQLRIKSQAMEGLLQKINYFFIRRFTACWIPDEAGENNLSGELSHGFPLLENASYIGLLSRFHGFQNEVIPEIKYDILVLLSGPEPQRTILEELLMVQLKKTKYKTLIVQGRTEINEEVNHSENIRVVSRLATKELYGAIRDSEMIISRPGYSTLMDLACLGKKAIFIPTPGQTEQEYLAEYLMKKGIAYFMKQDEIDLKKALEESKKYSGFTENFKINKFKKGVDDLLHLLHKCIER